MMNNVLSNNQPGERVATMLRSRAGVAPLRAAPAVRFRQDGGWLLVEVTVAVVVIALATLSSMTITLSSATLDATNRENEIATATARQVLEQIRATPFDQVFATFNADSADDPAGPGTALGSEFQILSGETYEALNTVTGCNCGPGGGATPAYEPAPTLSPLPEYGTRTFRSPAAMDITVTLPVNSSGELDETVAQMAPGMTTDLNGDGNISGGDRSSDYKILPVMVRVQWQGLLGTRVLEFPKLITRSR